MRTQIKKAAKTIVKRIPHIDVAKRLENVQEDLVRMFKGDSWINASTGLGGDYDPAVGTYFGARTRLSSTTLDRLYVFNALARRIVDRPAYDATRERFDVKWPDDPMEELQDKLQNEFKRTGFFKHLFTTISRARLTGTALLVPAWDDGTADTKDPKALTRPLDMSKVKGIKHFQVFDRSQVEPLNGMINDNLQSSNYGRAEVYTIRSDLSGKRLDIHHTRVIRIDGIEAPLRMMIENDGFGFSVLDMIFPELRTYGSSIQYAENIMKDLTQDVFQVSNLKQLLASNNTEQIRERFRLIRLAKSILNAVIIGADEKYEKRSTPATGAHELLEQFQFALGAATGIPLTFLFARSPAGQNATGDSDITNYYDQIAAFQEADLRGPCEQVTSGMLQGLGASPEEIESMQIEFRSLWQMSDHDKAEIEDLQASADEKRINSKVLLPEEVATSRFGTHDSPIQLDEALRKQRQTEEEEMRSLLTMANEDPDNEDQPAPGPGAKEEEVMK